MDDSRRVYFIGAGASKQDRFPLTAELKYGIGWAAQREPERFELLARYLKHIYRVEDTSLRLCSEVWEQMRRRTTDAPSHDTVPEMPDVTDVLSILDWTIRDQSSFGPGSQSDLKTVSSVGHIGMVRDLVVQALCYSLGTYCDLDSASSTRQFVDAILPTDAVVTTNWDLLIDAARDARFGSGPEDYGVGGHVQMEQATDPRDGVRPLLLKLHGSLSWRYCPRCQRLVIDPRNHVAGERRERAVCLCTCPYSEVIVTPSFVREYRNVHLLAIWREALLALAQADEWVFIGYSLPPDDVGIRALLYRARCIRDDRGMNTPRLLVVTGPSGRDATVRRYRSIVREAREYASGFAEFAGELAGDTISAV